VGIVLAIVLVVLDKAGKLKGPMLLVLLAVAACMTLPLAMGTPWVSDAASGILRFTRGMFLVFFVGLVYSALAMWISTDTPVGTRDKEAAMPGPSGTRQVSGPPAQVSGSSAPSIPSAAETLPVMRASLGVMLNPVRRGLPKQLSFTTGGAGPQEFSFEEHPKRVLFESPSTVVVDTELPREIEISGKKATVVRFTGKGFVVDDHGATISGKATLLEAAAKDHIKSDSGPGKAVSAPTAVLQPPKERAHSGTDPIADLARFIDEADKIQQRFLETNDAKAELKESDEWANRVYEYLQRSLDNSYAIQFRNAHGTAWMGMPVNHSVEGGGYWQNIEGKKNCLNEFVGELRRAKND
jgi:hypothetical protein